jgi:hypothetical protein
MIPLVNEMGPVYVSPQGLTILRNGPAPSVLEDVLNFSCSAAPNPRYRAGRSRSRSRSQPTDLAARRYGGPHARTLHAKYQPPLMQSRGCCYYSWQQRKRLVTRLLIPVKKKRLLILANCFVPSRDKLRSLKVVS